MRPREHSHELIDNRNLDLINLIVRYKYYFKPISLRIFLGLMFKAALSFSVDGGWSPWGNWTSCSVTCGKGRQTRTRNCSNPVPQFGGKDCQGKLEDAQSCSDKKHCPSEFTILFLLSGVTRDPGQGRVLQCGYSSRTTVEEN